jgi:hypothetical protein
LAPVEVTVDLPKIRIADKENGPRDLSEVQKKILSLQDFDIVVSVTSSSSTLSHSGNLPKGLFSAHIKIERAQWPRVCRKWKNRSTGHSGDVVKKRRKKVFVKNWG